jgi:hypothetical protein
MPEPTSLSTEEFVIVDEEQMDLEIVEFDWTGSNAAKICESCKKKI